MYECFPKLFKFKNVTKHQSNNFFFKLVEFWENFIKQVHHDSYLEEKLLAQNVLSLAWFFNTEMMPNRASPSVSANCYSIYLSFSVFKWCIILIVTNLTCTALEHARLQSRAGWYDVFRMNKLVAFKCWKINLKMIRTRTCLL